MKWVPQDQMETPYCNFNYKHFVIFSGFLSKARHQSAGYSVSQNLVNFEFDSHLELGIFSELSGVRILLLPNYKLTCPDLTKKLLKWKMASECCLI